MIRVKAVNLLIESQLPEDIRDVNRKYDSRGISALMAEVAEKYPDDYERISKMVQDVGRRTSLLQGETIGVEDLHPVFDKDKLIGKMKSEIETARRRIDNPERFEEERLRIWNKYGDQIKNRTMSEAVKKNNPLGLSVMSGARGKPPQLQAMLSTPGLYTDYKDRVIPSFVEKSFSEGIRPIDFLAGTFGTRKSVISTKRNTAMGGDYSKMLSQITAREVITEDDCGTRNGIDLDVNDDSLKGRVLARPAGDLPAGTVLDRQALAQLRKSNPGKVLARSPLTCDVGEGLCKSCVGAMSGGKLPSIGDHVGITASNSVGAPIAQAALNQKHQSGMSAGAKKEFSGFDYISQFSQAPENFPEGAVLAEQEGKVTGIRDAEQGGKYVTVGNDEHYISPDFKVLVSEGDRLEPGDQISDGLINPRDILRLRGLGSARRYYAERLNKLLEDSGAGGDMRNTEIIARAAMNHIRVDDPDSDDYLPDDVVTYNKFRVNYMPPEDAKDVDISNAEGKFLQKPTLHYSIGTRLTPKMIKRIRGAGYSSVPVSDKPALFEPVMSNLRRAGHISDDWLAKQHTSYLAQNLVGSAVRGEDTDVEENVHFVPRLSIGKDFGKNVERTGKF